MRAAARSVRPPQGMDASRFATTEAHCPGARRAVFVAGYLPGESVSCGEKPAEESGSWLDWFTGGDSKPAPDAPSTDEPPASEAVQQ